MKTILMAAVLAGAGLAISGCTDPIPGLQDTIVQPPQVLMSDYIRQAQLRVEVLPPERVGAGQLKVGGQLRNLADWVQSLDYKVWFVDERGAPVDNPIGWQHVTIPQRGYEAFSATSMSAAARDFRIEIRRAQ
jgi:hypothetical protein